MSKIQNIFAIAFLLVVILEQSHCGSDKVHVQVDLDKCTLAYMKDLVKKACIKAHKLPKRHAEINDPTLDFPVELVPLDLAMGNVRRKRDEFLTYFNYCCENIAFCETNMPCVV